MSITVRVKFRKVSERSTPGEYREEEVRLGVTKVVTVVPSKVLERKEEEGWQEFLIDTDNGTSALRKALDQFWVQHKGRGYSEGGFLIMVDVLGAELVYPDGEKVWLKSGTLVYKWWEKERPQSRYMCEISGGGVSVNLDPRTGEVRTTPIPLPPIPEFPMSEERRSSLFEEVSNPFSWKYPTLPKKLSSFKAALEYAQAISYYAYWADLWRAPDGEFVVTSEGYYGYEARED